MRYKVNKAIAGLSVVAIFGMFVASNEPAIAPFRGTALEPILQSLHYENAIIFNLCVGFLGGVVVWVLNVLLPEKQVRSILRDNLRRQYRNFRQDVISVLLGAQGSYPAGLPEGLSEPTAFRAYYRGGNEQRWYDALNYRPSTPGERDPTTEVAVKSTARTHCSHLR